MKVSAVKDMIDKIVAEYGDFEIGDPKEITISRGTAQWICGWSAQVISNGISFHGEGFHSGKFVGTEAQRDRLNGQLFGNIPSDDEMGPETVRTFLP